MASLFSLARYAARLSSILAVVAMIAVSSPPNTIAEESLFSDAGDYTNHPGDYTDHPNAASLWKGYCDPGAIFWSQPPGENFWTIDYLIDTMFSSRTCYQFGTPHGYVPKYAPVSKLDWSLNSVWTGLRIGAHEPNWDIQFKWLTPLSKSIDGHIADYDWGINKPVDPSSLDSLSYSSERWTEGQKIEIEGNYRVTERLFALPIELRPLIGFRFQRLNMTAFSGDQLIPDDGPFQPPFDGDIGTFNQQYYIGYAGAQLRSCLHWADRAPIILTAQADYGATAGYNVDHHLYYEYFGVHRYTMERTWGDAIHFAVSAEAQFTDRLSLGIQAEHLQINTTGVHRWTMSGNTRPVDESWSNGVKVDSHQNSITVYLRLKI